MKKELFSDLLKSLQQAREIADGNKRPSRHFRVAPVDIKALRKKLKFSQAQFADVIGIPVATLRNWEQGRTNPEGPARVLITALKNDPRGVIKAIHA